MKNIHLIRKPRITEKAGLKADSLNVYTFEVDKNATKDLVRKAVKELYKVTAIKINMLKLPAKKVVRGGKVGAKSAIKKAMVTLKKGDKIDFI